MGTRNFTEAYFKMARLIKEFGVRENGRQQGELKAVHNESFTLENPRCSVLESYERNMSLKYAAGEFLAYLRGTDDPKVYGFYAKKWLDILCDGKIGSSYGKRLFAIRENGRSRWDDAMDALVANPHSKNAIIMFRDDSDNLDSHQDDQCCTLYWHFHIDKNDKLNMHACMRSEDFWYGLPYDVFCFTRFMQMFLFQLNAKISATYGSGAKQYELGAYTHQMLNLHIYKQQYGKLDALCKEAENYFNWSPDHFVPFAYPDYDERVDAQKNKLLTWEEYYREDVLTPLDTKAEELRNSKFRPFWEILGTWLVVKTKFAKWDKEVCERIADAQEAAKQSKCIDHKVGCCLTNADVTVKSTGCNTVINCNQKCDDKLTRVCNVKHGEICALENWKNPMANTPTKAYVTLFPCLPCLRALEKAGVKEIHVEGIPHKGAVGGAKIYCYMTRRKTVEAGLN